MLSTDSSKACCVVFADRNTHVSDQQHSKLRVGSVYLELSHTSYVLLGTDLPIDNLTALCEHRLSRIFVNLLLYSVPQGWGSQYAEFTVLFPD